MPWVAQRFTAPCCVIVAPHAVKIEVVGKLSTWRKARILARVAGQQAGRSRTLNAAWSAVRTTARSFGRVIHLLWLEVTGVIFLIMALSFGGATVKEYGRFHTGQVGPGRVGAALLFTVAFAWFGLSSFWRVRRKSQRQ
jgi:hypothetical protein